VEGVVVRYYRFGKPNEVLRVEKKELHRLGPGEILVKVRARPINPSDLIPVRGSYPHRTILPAVPGFEGVGDVVAVGDGVPYQLLGKRVLPLQGENTWQEYVNAPAKYAITVPDGIDDETACQLYINPVTAWLICSSVLRLSLGDTLVVNAGGSAIGRIFAQLSKVFGYRMIALTRCDRHTADLYRLGAAFVINTNEEPFQKRIAELTQGRGAAAAVDSIGGQDGEKLVGCLTSTGKIVSIGLLSGIPALWHEATKGTQVQVHLFWLRRWVQTCKHDEWEQVFMQITRLVREKKMVMMNTGATFDLSDIINAVNVAESRILGKVILLS
jgi:NADPH:quinone reductase-like Zn-dependent oxidoreductase